jgi:GT2 family glycosyltransferase
VSARVRLRPAGLASAFPVAHFPKWERPRAAGRFLEVDGEKLWVRGVTYGTFRPESDGSQYGTPERVERDFHLMAASGVSAVRVYTVPPPWLLDAAARHGLRVQVDVPWEQHVTFLDDRRRARAIEDRVRAGVAACAGHPAILGFAVGNEIPAPIVRWHGRRRIERYLERLYRAAKAEDPGALVTYVNYPTTEYLDLPFLDVVAFNVYLEARDRLEAYLARLLNLAGDRPLILAEAGLDSRRHGLATQAAVLDWQVRASFAAGAAGVFVFSWTDEWHRGGFDIQDWDFGLTRRDRRPKPALAAVRRAFADLPLPKARPWPRVSVVVCSYNGARTIRDCLDGLVQLEYPDFEVIVVDDGSTDETAQIAREYGFRVISTPNRGLSSARNTGLAAATGELVAYIDDDAWPDPHWLTYVADTFLRTEHVAVGGPNLPPPGDGPIAACVANAPGGPNHVLLGDREAEHIPGCNMVFRKTALRAIGGFDPRFRVAGDDVDVCWRLQARGGSIGFHPAAVVWHHRRNSLRAYWRQQQGYGKAEALLAEKWPEKYNDLGHVGWAGRLYGPGLARLFGRGGRIYHGTWGTAPFQSLYQPAPGRLASLVAVPEWYLVTLGLAAMTLLGVGWPPLLLAAGPLCLLAVAAMGLQAARGAARARFGPAHGAWRLRVLTALLHLAQPLARLAGRLRHGLGPWWRRAPWGPVLARPWRAALWRERWESTPATLDALRRSIAATGVRVRVGGPCDRWDLEARVGAFGAVRLLAAVEEHGGGRQLVRLRAWPRGTAAWVAVAALLAALAGAAVVDGAPVTGALLALGALLPAVRVALDCAAGMAAVRGALRAPAVPRPAEARPSAGASLESAA